MLTIVVILKISLLRAYFIIDMDRGKCAYGLITVSVSLLARYRNEDGKEKKVQLAQSYFTKPIQRICNEIDEIIADDNGL